jgi:hypothetical protein
MSSEGYLRDSVVVLTTDEAVLVRHAMWELSLPREWVEARAALCDFLARRCSRKQVPGEDAQLHNVLHLFGEAGCLSAESGRESYQLREVRAIFRPLCATWYGRYYAHPLWDRLRDGSLSRNALVAWLIHNYHVSRSVGMTDARSAVRLSRAPLRDVFCETALDEFAHCDAFYFVRHPGLSIDDEQVKAYLPLPSSQAFDQEMLRIAEDDWLAHVLVALFQETTAGFYEDVKEFYHIVEERYRLPGLFAPWLRHVEYDLGHDHAQQFTALLDSDEEIVGDVVTCALAHAHFTFLFLLHALDEILGEDRHDDRVCLRMPPNAAPPLATIALPSRAPEEDVSFLRADLSRSLLRALSFSSGHDEVILFGRLALETRRVDGGRVASASQCVASTTNRSL